LDIFVKSITDAPDSEIASRVFAPPSAFSEPRLIFTHWALQVPIRHVSSPVSTSLSGGTAISAAAGAGLGAASEEGAELAPADGVSCGFLLQASIAVSTHAPTSTQAKVLGMPVS
jgi:hypothetical protein